MYMDLQYLFYTLSYIPIFTLVTFLLKLFQLQPLGALSVGFLVLLHSSITVIIFIIFLELPYLLAP